MRIIGILMLFIFSNNFLANIALRSFEYSPTVLKEQNQTAIVLSGITTAGMEPQNQFHLNAGGDRITEAIRLYHQGSLGQIIISGGAADLNFPEYNEGHSLARMAMDLKVNKEDILLENRSRNTHENAEFCGEMIKNKEKAYVLITSAFHMQRAIKCFEKEGFTIVPYPVDYQVNESISLSDFIPGDQAFRKWNILTKEIVGLIMYRLMGYI